MDRALGLFSCPGIRSERLILISFYTGKKQDSSCLGSLLQNSSRPGIPPVELLPDGIPPEMGFLPKRDSSRKWRWIFFSGRNPVLGGIPFWEESHFGRNPVLGGIPFWEESRFGRNPVSGGIPFPEESRFGRNPLIISQPLTHWGRFLIKQPHKLN